MKKLLLFALMAMTMTVSHAQSDGILSHFSLSAGIGTSGFTADLGTMVGNHIGLRGGIDYMPKINYNDDLNLTHVYEDYDVDPADLPDGVDISNLPTSVAVKGTLNNFTGHFLMDLYPTNDGDFHFTVGAYLANKESVITACNKDEGSLILVSDFNARRGAYADVPAEYGLVTARMGKYDIMPDDKGNANVYVKVAKLRPYAGIGFGRTVSRTRLDCQFDLGAYFWGTPKVYDGVSGQRLSSEGAQGEDHGVLKFISKVSVYPVLTLRISGRLF